MSSEVPAAPADSAGAAPEGSPLGRLAARRQELQAQRTPLDLDVPGYGGALVARYGFVGYQEAAKTAKRLERVPDEAARNLLGCIDQLTMACIGLFERDDDGELTQVADGFGPDLAEILGFEAETAREVVQGTFPDEWAIIRQAQAHSEWLNRESPEVDSDLLGEA
ncbi:MAG: hypothetical protein JWM31_1257 [Solirubrobacterales bacterium]|nr:hypothetical protein [Solirubrobacterales bacterium]